MQIAKPEKLCRYPTETFLPQLYYNSDNFDPVSRTINIVRPSLVEDGFWWSTLNLSGHRLKEIEETD
ncbi:hypothetical protein KL930_004714 [Ogataea haglerorum]|uniref:Uncharacterized protein n=1 Tax=Ogataea haglerorum TaxID=1937702 RepID=A0AAN6D2A6_9ASCO|nr:uncharacterized protein KL911_000544 [Ogataea haglerorum]KAG7699362.1 hypothetical protein KL915_001654 [Ogataea haglerorum]KAG7710404.1 hypothetical protein KL914_001314 [Ogataea haglerorum]KAG7710815.1 hypothetical protein KL950_000781 [Ogataea haglerorum]KAG7714565.1 hypothetical protein KL913_004335 [Ogataea haglerorum]KAG7715335.1 hypothetical protein KL949_004249 [Ogataea haglerorum]